MDGCVAVGLYRHAVTEENLGKKYIGWHDPPLMETEHMRLAAKAPCYPKYDLIYTSDLQRCRETAAAIFPDTQVIESPLLREIHFGYWETKTYEELKDDYVYRKWLNDQSKPIPGGESLHEFKERLDQFWTGLLGDSHSPEIVEKYERQRNKCSRVALMTHGGVIRHFLSKWSSEPKSFWEWSIPFAKGYELRWSAEEWRRESTCSSLLEVPSTESPNG
jgi:alpha-ribazole phosphatase